MVNIKKILASLAITSVLALSTNAFAEGASDAAVRAAGEGTVAAMEKAVSLNAAGADKAEVEDALRDARNLQKEFRFEGTERMRQNAGNLMRTARAQVKDGDPAAKATLEELLGMYKEMMTTYNKTHR